MVFPDVDHSFLFLFFQHLTVHAGFSAMEMFLREYDEADARMHERTLRDIVYRYFLLLELCDCLPPLRSIPPFVSSLHVVVLFRALESFASVSLYVTSLLYDFGKGHHVK